MLAEQVLSESGHAAGQPAPCYRAGRNVAVNGVAPELLRPKRGLIAEAMSDIADQVKDAVEVGGDSRLNTAIAVVVSITATFIAMCNVKDGNIGQAMAQAQANSVDAWAYYQAKGTKQHLAESMVDQLTIQRDLLPGASPEARALLDRKIAEYSARAKLYESEKEKIKQIGRAVSERIRSAELSRRPVRHGGRDAVAQHRAARRDGAHAQALAVRGRRGVRALRHGPRDIGLPRLRVPPGRAREALELSLGLAQR